MNMNFFARSFHGALLLCIASIATRAAAAESLRWVTVSGTAELAQNNTGYLLASNSSTVISLPAKPPMGAIVRVTGVGTGGWSILANKGQSIPANVSLRFGLLGSSGTISSIASSSDGTKLVAGVYGGLLYTSIDGGATWQSNSADQGDWVSVALSAEGDLLLADTNPGGLFESNNAGAVWFAEDAGEISCGAVACSADGSRVAQVCGGIPILGPKEA